MNIVRATVLFVAAIALMASTSWAQSAGGADAGATVFLVCKTCHSLEPGKNGVGPSLHGVFGRKAGTESGFNYSPAMVNSNVVWNEDTLSKYLADPKGFIPGNKMPFPGLADAQKRQAVITYLKQAAQ